MTQSFKTILIFILAYLVTVFIRYLNSYKKTHFVLVLIDIRQNLIISGAFLQQP